MSLPTDANLTKLRILCSREKEKLDSLKAECQTKIAEQTTLYEEKWFAFLKRCEELGFCAFCEKKTEECKCVFRG